jgi:hypothetical protein
MPQLEINGINLPINPALHTWQELLEELESKHLGVGKVIGAVHFDGTEVSEFREESVLTRSIKSIGEVRIEAVSLKEMVKSALIESEGYLLSLQTSLVDVAETFRQQQTDPANSKLTQVFEGIKMFVALLRGIELSLANSLNGRPSMVEQIFEEMAPTLESLIESQIQKDWVLVADILEFELLANLTSFERILAEFKQLLRPA